MAKKIDPVKAKEKRQKVIAVAGGVILLILLAIQGPKLLKHFHHSAPAAATPATVASGPATGSSTSLAAPTLAGANPTAPAAGSTNGSGTLTSGDAAPPVEQGQLASFSLFTSKDPFAQQISDGTNSTTPTGSSGTGSSGSGTGTSGSGSTTPAPGTAVIAVNGTLMAVTVGSDFPQPTANDPSAQPLFHLVSLTAHTAKISIAGGSYTSGAATVTLRENRPVTLLNTADGTRYKLVLKPQGTEVPAATTGSGTTTTTPTAPAP